MTKNSCVSINEHAFGEVNQHLFLGLSVVSFSSSVGFGQQSSELTVTLVNDPCHNASGKVYLDTNLDLQSTTGDDPGFVGNAYNIIGMPAVFKFEDFEYAGIIQSYRNSVSPAGSGVYEVKLASPTNLLDGINLIIGEYAGAVNGLPNVINVYGYYESGTCSNFGTSYTTDAGMPWSFIKNAVHYICNTLPATASNFALDGRIKFVDDTSNIGYGIIGNVTDSNYLIDLTEVPDGPSYYKIAGTSVSLMDAISQVCEDAGYDFYVELIPVKDVGGSQTLKVIKVRTINRVPTPVAGAMSTFLVNNEDYVSSYAYGRELRNEYTNSMIIGGRKQELYQVCNVIADTDLSDDLIQPYWGFDTNNNVILSTLSAETVSGTGGAPFQEYYYQFEADTTYLRNSIKSVNYPSSITLNERELIAAVGGYDSWLSWATANCSDSIYPICYLEIDGTGTCSGCRGLFDLSEMMTAIANAVVPNEEGLRGADMVRAADPGPAIRDPNAQKNVDLQLVYDYINTYATEFYGKRYMVRIPQVCVAYDTDTLELTYSKQVADGAWDESLSVLGIPNPSSYASFFKDDAGKWNAFVRFNSAQNLNFSNLSEDQYGHVSGSGALSGINLLYVKCNVYDEIVFSDYSTFSDPRVVIELPNYVDLRNDEIEPSLKHLADALTGKGVARNDAVAKVKDWGLRIGRETFYEPTPNRYMQPDCAAIPLLNNQQVYGPWQAGTLGINGKTRVEQDDSLVPWNFGSMTDMNIAGQAKADTGISNMRYGEIGNIDIAGYPTIDLGAELLGYGAIPAQRSVLTRTVSSVAGGGGNPTYYYIEMVSGNAGWAGTYGPNITSINTSIGANGLTTNYTLRTFTPAFGYFDKANDERLKQIGRVRVNFERKLRERRPR